MAALKSIAAVVGLVIVTCAGARAETATVWNDHPNSRVRLVAGPSGVIGVELQLAPGWKTYWRMPGDAGVPPSFEWEGSENAAGFDVLYPAPVAMSDQGGTAIGYKGTVLFPVTFTHEAGKAAKIALEFSYGVCKDVCIPIDSKLALVLPPGGGQSSAPLTAAMALVPKVTADPVKATPALVSSTFDLMGAEPHITFRTRGAQDLFVEAPDGLFVPLTRKTGETGGVATYLIDLSKTPDVKDLVGKSLRVTVTGTGQSIETAVVLK